MEDTIVNNTQPEERLFKQSELNEIVGRVRKEAAERYAQQQPQMQQPQMSQDEIRKLAAEEIARQRDAWMQQQEQKRMEEEVQRIVNAYQSKIAGVNEKYQDFEQVARDLDMSRYPRVVQMLAENVDNSSDVLYELAKNRSKLAVLETAYERNPKDAIYDMMRLSDSIKSHQQAAAVKQPSAPLSQQKPSPTAGATQADMRSLKSKYRG